MKKKFRFRDGADPKKKVALDFGVLGEDKAKRLTGRLTREGFVVRGSRVVLIEGDDEEAERLASTLEDELEGDDVARLTADGEEDLNGDDLLLVDLDDGDEESVNSDDVGLDLDETKTEDDEELAPADVDPTKEEIDDILEDDEDLDALKGEDDEEPTFLKGEDEDVDDLDALKGEDDEEDPDFLKGEDEDSKSKDDEDERDIEVQMEALMRVAKLDEGYRDEVSTLVRAVADRMAERKVREARRGLRKEAVSAVRSAARKMKTINDQYLKSVAEDWRRENREAIKSSARTAVAESLVKGMFRVLKEHNVAVPAGKEDAFKKLAEAHDVLLRRNRRLEARVAAGERASMISESRQIVDEYTKGMSRVQRDRFVKTLESFEYDDARDFSRKAKTIFEGLFADKKATKSGILRESTTDPRGSFVGAREETDEVSRVAALLARR